MVYPTQGIAVFLFKAVYSGKIVSVNISSCSYCIIQITVSLFLVTVFMMFNLLIMCYLKFCSIISLTVITFGCLMFFLIFQVKKKILSSLFSFHVRFFLSCFYFCDFLVIFSLLLKYKLIFAVIFSIRKYLYIFNISVTLNFCFFFLLCLRLTYKTHTVFQRTAQHWLIQFF